MAEDKLAFNWEYLPEESFKKWKNIFQTPQNSMEEVFDLEGTLSDDPLTVSANGLEYELTSSWNEKSKKTYVSLLSLKYSRSKRSMRSDPCHN